MTGAGAVLAAIAALAPGAALAATRPPRLVTPAEAAVVVPGESVGIEIAEVPAGADEWESFVSLDGGRTYPLRATPHLPIAERSFFWTVPALPPGPVRVKLRFGIAGLEREFVLSRTFSIGTGGSGALVAPDPGSIGASPAAGEEQTVAWVDRAGGRARLVVPVPGRGIAPGRTWTAAMRASLPLPTRSAERVRPRGVATRLARPAPMLRRPEPIGRTIASLSRLNV